MYFCGGIITIEDIGQGIGSVPSPYHLRTLSVSCPYHLRTSSVCIGTERVQSRCGQDTLYRRRRRLPSASSVVNKIWNNDYH